MGFTDEVSALQPGMTLGNLQIVAFIGKGAIGEVYLAQHDILGKQFAVKVLPKGFAGTDGGDEVFKQAARVQTKLVHPSIVRVDDLGDEGMFYWLRMEYVEGEQTAQKVRLRSIEDLMRHRNGPLTEDEVRYYLYHSLVGLGFAHTQGVIHGDLKPANILLDPDGVKIAELGVVELLGHAWDDFHRLKHEPQMEPTPFDPLPGFCRSLPALLNTYEHYSPEQKAGQAPDVQSNLYTMGLIAYEMLTGRHGLSFDLPTKAVSRINPRWDEWFVRALAYEPEERFTTAIEMLEAMPGLEAASEEGTGQATA